MVTFRALLWEVSPAQRKFASALAGFCSLVVYLFLTFSQVFADEWDENYEVGKQQLERGEWTLAIASFQAALQIKPRPDHQATTSNLKLIPYLPYYYLGQAHLMLGNYAEALKNFQASLNAGAISQTGHLRTLRRLQSIAERLLEVSRMEESRARSNEKLDADLSRLNALITAEDHDAAVQLLNSLKSQGRDEQSLRLLEKLLMDIRRKAIQQAETMDLQTEAQQRLQAGLDYYLLGQYQNALNAFRDAERLDPETGNAKSWRQKTESEIQRLSLNVEQEKPSPPPEPEIIERIVTQTTAPVVLLRFPHQSSIETRDKNVLFSGRAGDDQGIASIEFTVNGQALLDSTGQRLIITPSDLNEAKHFSFSATVPLRLGENLVVITAWDVDLPAHRTVEQYSVTRLKPIYQTTTFVISAGALLLLTFGGIALTRIIKYRIAIINKYNPYIAGAPIRTEEMFFGRTQLLQRILNTIHNNSLMIYGPRRIGKTSLQHQLKRRLANLNDPEYDFVPVMVDLQGTNEEHFFTTLMEEIIDACKKRVNGDVTFRVQENRDNYSSRDLSRDLKSLLKILKDSTKRQLKLVLLIDEVDELNKYSEQANQRLRSVFMKTFAENLVAVMSGAHIRKNWQSEGSPWYNFFEEIPVPPFERRDAEALIKTPVEGIFSYTDEAVEKIIEYSECKPYVIQKFCVQVINRIIEEKRRRVTAEDVDAIAAEVLRQSGGEE